MRAFRFYEYQTTLSFCLEPELHNFLSSKMFEICDYFSDSSYQHQCYLLSFEDPCYSDED